MNWLVRFYLRNDKFAGCFGIVVLLIIFGMVGIGFVAGLMSRPPEF